MVSEAGTYPRFSFSKTVSDLFGSIGRNFLILAVLAMLLSGLPNAIYAGVALQSLGLFVNAQSVFSGGLLDVFTPTFVIGWLVTICGAVAAQAGMTAVVLGDLRGKPLDFAAAFAAALRYFLPVFGITIVYYLAAASVIALPMLAIFGLVAGAAGGIGAAFSAVILLFLVIVPLLLFIVIVWIAAVPAAIEERITIFASLGRSWSLTSGHRWKILGMIIIYLFVVMMVSSAISAATMPIMMADPAMTNSLDGMTPFMIAQSFLGALTLIITYPALAAIYVNLRAAKEGFGDESVADIFE
ncbi:MAG: hypothetical protein AAGE05_12205 [Pseudomonadota bacterium]